MFRLIISIAVAALMFVVIIFFVIGGESSYVLETWFEVSPLSNIRQGVWLSKFREVAFNAACVAFAFAVIWHCVSFGMYRIKDWRNAGGQNTWWLIAIIMFVAIGIYGWIYTPEAQDLGKTLAILLYLFNSIFIYWFSSFLLSPASVKYVPPLSRYSLTQRIPLNF
jgi:hypothetical protein